MRRKKRICPTFFASCCRTYIQSDDKQKQPIKTANQITTPYIFILLFFLFERKKGKASVRTSAKALASRRSRVPCLLRVPHPLPWSPAAAYAGNQTRP